MEDKRSIEFSRYDLDIMDEVLDLVRDKLRHYPDGEMGWSGETVEAFDAIDSRFHEARKSLGMH